MKKSRLGKYVIYRHDGFPEALGFTASFKPVLISFRRIKDAIKLKQGWYIVHKKPNKEKLLVRLEDLEPIDSMFLLWLGKRMRKRFTAIVKEQGKVDVGMKVVAPREVPISDRTLGVLKLKPRGVIEFKRLSWGQALLELKFSEKILVSRNGNLMLLTVAE